eukprot:scaffold2149_cov187-Cylindrotheca_fusiformis.AAC.5
MGNIDKALSLFDELQKFGLQDEVDLHTLGAVIHALGKPSKETRERAIEITEFLVRIIVSRYQEGTAKLSTKSISWVFENLIRLWSKQRGPEGTSRVVDIIAEMESLDKEYPGHFKPTSRTYLLAIDALAKCGQANAGEEALAMLKKVEEPTTRILASALSSVTRSPGRAMTKTAESLYQQILERYRNGDRSASPNGRTLTTVLNAILRAQDPRCADRALGMLRQTIELGRENVGDLAPNTIAFNCVLSGLARQKSSVEAMALFDEMKTLRTSGFDSAPDAISYACVSRAITSDPRKSTAMQQMDKLVAEVQSEVENGRLQPDTRLYNTLIKSYASISRTMETAADTANDLLLQLEISTTGDKGTRPDVLTYKFVCEACAMSRASHSLKRTEDVFRKAHALAEKGVIGPLDCDFAYYTVLALTRCGEEDALQRAEGFVKEMEATASKLLNTRSYNALLSAYANSLDPNKVARASTIFDRLVEMKKSGQEKCGPDTCSLNWLILAAANSFDDPLRNKESFETALSNFKLLHTAGADTKPNILSYEFFLRACHRLLPSGETQRKLVGKAFEQCSRRGLVTGAICGEAAKSDLPMILDALEQIEVSGNEATGLIPMTWCQNVPHRQRFRKVSLVRSSNVED